VLILNIHIPLGLGVIFHTKAGIDWKNFSKFIKSFSHMVITEKRTKIGQA
jgi:hypothetical protein